MLLLALTGLLPHGSAWSDAMPPRSGVIDDLSQEAPMASVGTRWQLITDRVMGGVSEGTMVREVVFGRPAIRMRGDVSLDNNGGFVQMALDLSPTGGEVDANDWLGVELDVLGNDELYSLHLRTSDLTRPWQSYRQSFRASDTWSTIRLAFGHFTPHRTEAPLDLRRLRRLGVVAIGRAFTADLSLGGIRFFA